MNVSFSLPNATKRFVNCSDPKFTHIPIHTPIARYGVVMFSAYALPVIIVFGVIGNLMALVILRKASKKVTSHFYLWCLAIFDILSLISYMPAFWTAIVMKVYYFYLYGPNNPANWVEHYFMGGGICSFRLVFTFTARTCSVWTIVLVTFERFLLVLFPLKGIRFCTMRNAKISIVILVIISILINSPWWFSFDIFPKPCFPNGICVPNKILFVKRIIEFIFLTIIPAIFIMVCNVCIIVTLRKRKSMSILVDRAEAKRQERIITMRLLCVSFAFLILTFPSLVIVTIHTIHHFNGDNSHLSGWQADAFVLSVILFSVNLAINFVIYCLTGKHFREATWCLLKCDLVNMRRYRNYLINEESTNHNETEKVHMTDMTHHDNTIDS